MPQGATDICWSQLWGHPELIGRYLVLTLAWWKGAAPWYLVPITSIEVAQHVHRLEDSLRSTITRTHFMSRFWRRQHLYSHWLAMACVGLHPRLHLKTFPFCVRRPLLPRVPASSRVIHTWHVHSLWSRIVDAGQASSGTICFGVRIGKITCNKAFISHDPMTLIPLSNLFTVSFSFQVRGIERKNTGFE